MQKRFPWKVVFYVPYMNHFVSSPNLTWDLRPIFSFLILPRQKMSPNEHLEYFQSIAE